MSDSLPLVLEQINALLAASADAAPTADERSAAEAIARALAVSA
ncbi:hypothetical protein ABIE78_003651 [Sinorhizobium fredii]|uniref:Uncharacterized protein n=1 Tax=Sinorhizobium fredii (strain USDA 257) TaxID=1185652 RepID=I3X3V2_SINF2|nr:hypothetical protein USDA257_c19730 [Sinorhizobium fredii USDA 257]